MIALYQAARAKSVPLVSIRTADQVACERALVDATEPGHALIRWDQARGLQPINDAGKTHMSKAGVPAGAETQSFPDAMRAALKLPQGSVVIVHNAHRQLQAQEPLAIAESVQAVANIRGPFSRTFRMLALMGPDVPLPLELQRDVVPLTDPLPGSEAMRPLIQKLYAKAKGLAPATVPDLTEEILAKADDAVSGLSLFQAEQDLALSLGENGLDLPALWERKRIDIEQTPGLSVYRGKETLDDLRGLEAIKARLRAHKTARTPLGPVVWIDEGADVFQNVESDTSGNKTDQQRMLLMKMEQHNWRGVILVGVPGTGKSALARGFGNEAGVPTIELDLAGMESKWQGESEQNLRHAIEVIERIGRGHAFVILTCNSLKGIRPQFMARFRRGTFFVDRPTAAERDAIWQLYLKKYRLEDGKGPMQKAAKVLKEGWRYVGPRPDDRGWVGREIREACESAWDCGITLEEAARFIVPISKSRGHDIAVMRQEANGRFLDASKGGVYEYEAEPQGEEDRAMALSAGVPS